MRSAIFYSTPSQLILAPATTHLPPSTMSSSAGKCTRTDTNTESAASDAGRPSSPTGSASGANAPPPKRLRGPDTAPGAADDAPAADAPGNDQAPVVVEGADADVELALHPNAPDGGLAATAAIAHQAIAALQVPQLTGTQKRAKFMAKYRGMTPEDVLGKCLACFQLP